MGKVSTRLSGAIWRAKQSAFLEACTRCGRIALAAQAAGVNRDMHYAWLKDRIPVRLRAITCDARRTT